MKEGIGIMRAVQIIWMMSLTLTFVAATLDWRTRRIPNWLTVPALIAGIAVHTALNGWHGTLFALEGAALALVLLLPPVMVRVLGAGDWKLMGVVGALMGPILMLFILFVSILVA